MPIPVTCSCGRALRVKDQFPGRKVRCPACGGVLSVPEPEEGSGADDEAMDVLRSDPSPGESPRRTARAEPAPPESVTARRPPERAAWRPRAEGVTKQRPPRLPKRRAGRAGSPRVAFEPGWFGSINAGMVGGLLMMLIAVAWFVVGLMVGIIFFYPPVLLVLGFIALVRGLATRR